MDAADDDEEFGLRAYREIQAELGMWGDDVAAPSPRAPRSGPPAKETAPASGGWGRGPSGGDDAAAGAADDAAAADGDDAAAGEGGERSSPSPSGRGTAGARTPGPSGGGRGGRRGEGVQTPEPPQGLPPMTPDDDEGAIVVVNDDGDGDFAKATEKLIGDGSDSFQPYHDALIIYLRSRDRLSRLMVRDTDVSMMSIDGDDPAVDAIAEAEAALDEAEMKFLDSLASVCLSRVVGANGMAGGSMGGDEDVYSEASRNEGNLWDLISSLRAGGLDSLLYCVDGEEIPELTLANDPAAMVESPPAEALAACLGGEECKASLPLKRLNSALGWIEACHGRKFEESLNRDFEGNDPMLPPPRRRTMWPSTLAGLKQRGRRSAGAFHPDAPLKSAFGGRSNSPTDVSSFLSPDDEVDDARLLRACFMLIQSGRTEEATKLVTDCGQGWRAAMWTGGEPLGADGRGNPTRGLWKTQCRKISRQMGQLANSDTSSMVDDAGSSGLYPSLAYEAAILAILSDDADSALRNPVFGTWEDGVQALLHSETGVIEDDVLRSHNQARVEACAASGGHFPHPGTEPNVAENDSAPRGHGGDLGTALQRLETSPMERVREGGGDPFRNGMASFLVGQTALKEYMEECAQISLEADSDDDDACFLRFVVHLVLYVDTVRPDFCARLALPEGVDAATDGSIFSLKELLVLKYVACLSSRRGRWGHVALYTSLLSEDNMHETYSSFLIHVHTDRERRMALGQARDLFPGGMDLLVLRNVVRGLVLCDKESYVREPGEAAAPVGVAPVDARMMRSIHWLCYYPEHKPDALVCANMLLRRFLLSYAEEGGDASSNQDFYAPKVFLEKILPKDLIDMAMVQCQSQEYDDDVVGSISPLLMENLQAEFLSIETFLQAHTKYLQFLDAISNTSPCHKSSQPVEGSRSGLEAEIADKMERNAFRHKKAGLCKIIVEVARRASDALSGTLTFAGGWLVDGNPTEEDTEEARARAEELAAIRSALVPRAVRMLEEVLDKTAMWLEQVVHDTLIQFGGAGKDMLLALFESFDERFRSDDEEVPAAELLHTSRAAPGYWRKKALSLSSVVANDGNELHETFDNDELEGFLRLMAEQAYKFNRCTNSRTFFDC